MPCTAGFYCETPATILPCSAGTGSSLGAIKCISCAGDSASGTIGCPVHSFKQLREAVAAAPTDGSTQTDKFIEIDGDLPAWTSGDGMDDTASIVVVKPGQNVQIRGTSTIARSLLDAQGSSSSQRRFFDVESGAVLELSNLSLRRGYTVSSSLRVAYSRAVDRKSVV